MSADFFEKSSFVQTFGGRAREGNSANGLSRKSVNHFGKDHRGQKAHLATSYAMPTFHEVPAKKAVVLPDLFRIEPLIGLAQPIPLKPTIKRTVKPDRRLKDAPKVSLSSILA
jgi:hypothetical protein